MLVLKLQLLFSILASMLAFNNSNVTNSSSQLIKTNKDFIVSSNTNLFGCIDKRLGNSCFMLTEFSVPIDSLNCHEEYIFIKFNLLYPNKTFVKSTGYLADYESTSSVAEEQLTSEVCKKIKRLFIK